ncbi:MAG: UpxY family transcription antiterminator [Candidatus Hodarchaeota archaeon]
MKSIYGELNHKPHWYALYTRNRYEKKIENLLRQKKIETYLPLNTVYHKWSDRYKKITVPLFSCYIFVFISLKERLTVLQTNGAIKLVTHGGIPAVIPEDQINAIKILLDSQREVIPVDCFTPGKRVKIVRGLLCGLEGTLINKNNKNRFVMIIDGIMQGISIQIDYHDLKIIA